MGRGKRLNESEEKKILELKQQQSSVAKISKVIIRSCKVIHNFLKNVEDYGKRKVLVGRYRYPIVISEQFYG